MPKSPSERFFKFVHENIAVLEMKKFVPRQRKHKVLARAKSDRKRVSSVEDSNAIEHVPQSKVDAEEKRYQLKDQIRQELPQASGKKAKRLEKYIETKLRKDENRVLIEKLAHSTTDTSLLQSSKKLGRGRETKKEQLSRVLRDRQAGIDIDGNNDEVLFERADGEDQSGETPATSDEEAAQHRDLAATVRPIPTIPQSSNSLASGLKRPLDVDEDGRPMLQKRVRRGGIASRVPKTAQPDIADEEPAWDGFSSASESNSYIDNIDISEDSDLSEISDDDILSDQDDSSHSDEEGLSSSSDEPDTVDVKERSSAFKAWANQQRSKATGYEPVSIIQDMSSIAAIKDFKPRASEEDPLPAELATTKDAVRKSQGVVVARPIDIQAARLHLPVVAEEQKIMEAIHNNATVVVFGATGSGKTTQVPQFLFEAGYGSKKSITSGMIGVTQPRRVAAVSMAKRVTEELGDHGDAVAYQIRFEGTVSPNTSIKFMTDGVLLREVAQDISLRKYSAIVIDEAHERNVNTDILIGMLSRVVRLRQELAMEDPSITPLKLIIMSATIKVTDFTENTLLFPEPPPVVQAEGRQYPVTVHFSRRTHHDYVEELFRKITRGHRKLPPGGFLIFLTGQNEIVQLSKRLREYSASGQLVPGSQVRISGQDATLEVEDLDFGDYEVDEKNQYDESDDVDIDVDDTEFEVDEAVSGPSKMHVLHLYSLLPTKEQMKIFEPPPEGSRLIVLATNVAETSLTIPGIRYVFDCGRSKERRYNEQTGVQSFEIGWISKASASQRSGRAGRTGPGHCYRMYSSAVYERDFQDFGKPEILRMPIEGTVLQLKAMNLQHVINFPFPTPPDRHSLARAEKLLSYLSAISSTGQITPTGATMSIFPLSPRYSRILLIGHLHDCMPYTVALVAGLSAGDIFVPENQAIPIIEPKDDGAHFTNADRIQEDARAAARRTFNKVQKTFCFLDDRSDAIKLLQVVGEFAHDPTEAWCERHFVRHKILKEIFQLQRQITDLLKNNIPAFANLKFKDKLDPPTAKQVKALKQMVAAGFIDQVAIRADLTPIPSDVHRKPKRAIDVPYLPLLPSHSKHDDEDKAVYIHPASPLARLSLQECPEYIIYAYLQRATPTAHAPDKVPKTRMHALTDITGSQLASLAKGTPLLHYGKPIKEVVPKTDVKDGGEVRECWVIPYLRIPGAGDVGWPLPARKVTQRKVPGQGWTVE